MVNIYIESPYLGWYLIRKELISISNMESA